MYKPIPKSEPSPHFGIAECGEGTDDGRDHKREHQRWSRSRTRSISRRSRADGGKDSRADDRADSQQRDVDWPKRALQLVTFFLCRSQNVVEIFGAKDSA